jgi:hypothetical protein
MIKNFIQKYKAVLLAVVITAVVTSAVAFGYFANKNEKERASQKVETLQKTVEELQAKNEANQEASKEPEKDIPVEEAVIQQAPTIKKSVETAPIKAETEEKLVSCLTYAKTTVQVSKVECDLIKQKNESSKEIDVEYQKCISVCAAVYRASVPVTSKSQYDSTFGDGAYDDRVSECQDKQDGCNDDCLDMRNDQMKKLWK